MVGAGFNVESCCLWFMEVLFPFAFEVISPGRGFVPVKPLFFAINWSCSWVGWTTIAKFLALLQLFSLKFITLQLFVEAKCVRLIVFPCGLARLTTIGFTISFSSLLTPFSEWWPVLLAILLQLFIFPFAHFLTFLSFVFKRLQSPASSLFPSRWSLFPFLPFFA